MDKFKQIRAYHTEWLQVIFDWITIFPYLLHLAHKTTTRTTEIYAWMLRG